MLARRFTIVCLLATLFGMIFSVLAAETSRSPRAYALGVVIPCVFEDGQRCLPLRNR